MPRILDRIATMEPVLRTGRAVWDQSLLPRDEFAARLAAAREAGRRAGVGAILIFGHATSSECLTYLTNFVPSARWAALVIVPGTEPALLAGLGGQREEPYQRTVTWVRDLIHAPLSGATLREALTARGAPPGRVGVAGLRQLLPAGRAGDIEAALGRWQLVPVDAALAALWRATEPRAAAVLAAADSVLRQAKLQAVHAFAAARSPSRAAAAADRLARLSGCRDVRILTRSADGSLRPYQGVRPDDETGTLTCYLAAEWLGYWTELAFTYPRVLAYSGRGLAAALAEAGRQVRPGARPRQLVSGFTDGELHVRGLGLSIVDLPEMATGWEELRTGDVISLLAAQQAGCGIVLESSVLAVDQHGGAQLRAWSQ